MHISKMSVCMHVCVYVYECICVWVHMCMCVYVNVYLWADRRTNDESDGRTDG